MYNGKILQINPLNLQIEKIWNSMYEIEKIQKISHSSILHCCNNNTYRKTVNGYYWKYLRDYIKQINENNTFYSCFSTSFNNFQCNPFLSLHNMNGYMNPYFTTFDNEIFKDVIGYEGFYKVSNLGRVISLWNKPYIKEIIPQSNFDGYCRISLSKGNDDIKTVYIHRLVAQAFIPNPNSLPEINHKNEIKTDNRVENLEWCDSLYNMNYGSRIDRMVESNKKSFIKRST